MALFGLKPTGIACCACGKDTSNGGTPPVDPCSACKGTMCVLCHFSRSERGTRVHYCSRCRPVSLFA